MTEIGERKGFVDRGDPAAIDFTTSHFTTDGTYRDLDLSSIVPAGAVAVSLSVLIYDNAAGSFFGFRKKGNSNDVNRARIRTQVSNEVIEGDLVVAVDKDRKVQYIGSNLTFSEIDVVVKGWWI